MRNKVISIFVALMLLTLPSSMVFAVSNYNTTNNKQSNSNFSIEDIQKLLINADKAKWALSGKSTSNFIGLSPYGTLLSEVQYENSSNKKISSLEIVENLKKYYTDEMVDNLLNGPFYLIDNKIAWTPVTLCEWDMVTEKSQVKLIIDTPSIKLFNIQYFDGDYEDCYRWYRCEIIKCSDGKWRVNEIYELQEKYNPKKIIKDIKTIESSSYLEGYPPSNLMDMDFDTAWAEGVDGKGLGEWIKITFNNEIEVSSFKILNGYNKSHDLFFANGKPYKVLIEFSNGHSVVKDLWFEDCYEDNTIYLKEPIKTEYVKFTIVDAENGDYYSDTCISDIIIFSDIK